MSKVLKVVTCILFLLKDLALCQTTATALMNRTPLSPSTPGRPYESENKMGYKLFLLIACCQSPWAKDVNAGAQEHDDPMFLLFTCTSQRTSEHHKHSISEGHCGDVNVDQIAKRGEEYLKQRCSRWSDVISVLRDWRRLDDRAGGLRGICGGARRTECAPR